jgi:hypothetical protein
MPFASIISRDHGEPWPATGMSTQRWMDEVPVRQVRIRDLIATQSAVALAALVEDYRRGDQPHERDPHPHVIAWCGSLYLEDGHHRAIRALLRGEPTIDARVLEIP